MKFPTLASHLAVALLMSVSVSPRAEEWSPTKDRAKDPVINGRVLETFQRRGKVELDYAAPQQDTFIA